MSEATKVSPSPNPTMSGEAPLRANTSCSGASAQRTPSAYAPDDGSERLTNRGNDVALVYSSSKWATTSVSVSLVNVCPLAMSSARSR